MPLIDMGQVEEFEPMPSDWYDCVFSSFENVEESQSSGEPYIKFEFAVSEGDFVNRKLFRNHSLQAKSLWALKRTLISLGADPEEVSGEFDTDEVLQDLVGNPCRIKVGIRTYEGRDVNDVERIAPISVTV